MDKEWMENTHNEWLEMLEKREWPEDKFNKWLDKLKIDQ